LRLFLRSGRRPRQQRRAGHRKHRPASGQHGISPLRSALAANRCPLRPKTR